MKAIIIGVGNQTRHQARFEGCQEYLRRELAEVGISLDSMHLAPPRRAEVYAQLLEAASQEDLVLVLAAPDPAAAGAVTQAVCELLRLEPVGDETLARQLARRAAQHDKDWTKAEIEAFAAAPGGCRHIPNPAGMVQGYAVSAQNQLILVLPAVQSELTACMSSTARQMLTGLGGAVNAQRTLRAVELGDAPVRELLGDLLYSENPRATLHSQGGECELHITAAAATLTEARNACDQLARQAVERLGPLLTSGQGEPLDQHAGRLLGKNNLSVAVAESGTGGALSAAIKAGSGHGKVLAGGMTLSTDAQKSERLGVSKKLLSEAGGVSRRVAAAMAVLVRRAAGSKLGVAVTCGGPDHPGKEDLAYVAVTDGREVWAKKLAFPQGTPPEAAQNAACLQALNMLRLYAHRYPMLLPGGTPVDHAAPGIQTPMEKATAILGGYLARAQGMIKGMLPGSGRTGPGGAPANGQQSDDEEAMELNLLQRILQKKLTKNDGIRLGILGLSLLVFIGCIIYISSVFAESHKNKGLIQDQQSAYSNSDVRPEDVDGYPSAYLPKFAALYAQNEDIAGWIKIDGTKYLDMPVVQYIDNDFYERRDFTKADNQHGVAFVDYRVAQREPSTNTIIYAHNMNDGQMFGELLNYKSIEYYRTHPLVSYDSVFYEGDWKIFGVVVCKKDDPDFLYHSFIDKDSDQEMVEFVTKVRERSILNTKVDVRTDDKLLTLSTCDYTFKSETGERIARFVVFARKVREGESTDVDVAGATINTNPVMPAEWYSHLKRAQEAELKKQQEAAAAQASNKWLTAEEQQSLSAEEAKALAERREQQAQEYLTYDERETEDLDTMLYLIDYRRSEFKLFLDSDEKSLSLSKRISLARERREQAEAAGLSESDIEDAGSWSAIKNLMDGAGDKALRAIVDNNRRYLTYDDMSVGSVSELNKLLEQRRKDMALKADELGLKLNNYETKEEFDAAVSAAEGGANVQKEMDKVLADSKYRAYLNASDKNSCESAEELKQLAESRKAELAADLEKYKIDAGKYKNFDDLEAAIEDARIKAGEAAKLEQEKKERDEYFAANSKYLNDGDKNKSKAELEKLVADRESKYNAALGSFTSDQAKAKLEGITNWSQFDKALKEAQDIQKKEDEANKPPVNPNPPVNPDNKPGEGDQKPTEPEKPDPKPEEPDSKPDPKPEEPDPKPDPKPEEPDPKPDPKPEEPDPKPDPEPTEPVGPTDPEPSEPEGPTGGDGDQSGDGSGSGDDGTGGDDSTGGENSTGGDNSGEGEGEGGGDAPPPETSGDEPSADETPTNDAPAEG